MKILKLLTWIHYSRHVLVDSAIRHVIIIITEGRDIHSVGTSTGARCVGAVPRSEVLACLLGRSIRKS